MVVFPPSKAIYVVIKDLTKSKAKGLKLFLNTTIDISPELTSVPVSGEPQISQTTKLINPHFPKTHALVINRNYNLLMN